MQWERFLFRCRRSSEYCSSLRQVLVILQAWRSRWQPTPTTWATSCVVHSTLGFEGLGFCCAKVLKYGKGLYVGFGCSWVVLRCEFRLTVEVRTLSWKMSVLPPQTKARRKTSIDHPTSMFQLFGAYCKLPGFFVWSVI